LPSKIPLSVIFTILLSIEQNLKFHFNYSDAIYSRNNRFLFLRQLLVFQFLEHDRKMICKTSIWTLLAINSLGTFTGVSVSGVKHEGNG
jgi:hypothetical protein